jgi:putative SOS response-associated peptidase YedK
MCFYVAMSVQALTLEHRFGAKVPQQVQDRTPEPFINGFSHPEMLTWTNAGFKLMRWGLIPAWVRTREQALQIRSKTLNAKCETIQTRASYKDAIHQRRCIIPVSAFFEWHHQKEQKVPFRIEPSQGELLLLAGIYETWTSPSSQTPVNTFSILTCPANQMMARVHNTKQRMPVILDALTEPLWLQANTKLQQECCMQPAADHLLKAIPCSISGKN